ncbi:protein of unknown function [Trichlorobacter thiogenes]|uniref:YfiR family protein n=1 Tax=Trichlorobacter thiogenes TaxID=115783 RepID=A0A1T4R0W9_9BACT|nr:YfiR family protein [Trichlorobacter thiogenes]SKA09527.1 protein of unknown function [Trichlorobacter thiogenes]
MSSTCLTYPLISLLLFASLLVQTPTASAQEPDEYQIKAAMTYNMLRFMDWPDDNLPGQAAQMTICVAGKGPLGSAMGSLQGKTVKNRIITIQQLSSPPNTSGCEVLILSDLEQASRAGLLEKTRTAPILTVADSKGFARSGGVVGFVLQQGKIRFEINQAAAQRHRLRISAQLLKLAQIVTESP